MTKNDRAENVTTNFNQKSSTDSIADLFEKYRPIFHSIRKEERESALSFNIFNALGIARREVVFSRFLGYLLSPLADHGQGDLFLRKFLHGIPSVLQSQLTQASVFLEFNLGALGQADIVIHLSTGQCIVVENKIESGEQENQISRYQSWLASHPSPPGSSHLIVFLTPNGNDPTSASKIGCPVETMSYKNLSRIMQIEVLPSRLSQAVNQFAEICAEIGINADEQ